MTPSYLYDDSSILPDPNDIAPLINFISSLQKLGPTAKRASSPTRTYNAKEPLWSKDNVLMYTVSVLKKEVECGILPEDATLLPEEYMEEWLGVGKSSTPKGLARLSVPRAFWPCPPFPHASPATSFDSPTGSSRSSPTALPDLTLEYLSTFYQLQTIAQTLSKFSERADWTFYSCEQILANTIAVMKVVSVREEWASKRAEEVSSGEKAAAVNEELEGMEKGVDGGNDISGNMDAGNEKEGVDAGSEGLDAVVGQDDSASLSRDIVGELEGVTGDAKGKGKEKGYPDASRSQDYDSSIGQARDAQSSLQEPHQSSLGIQDLRPPIDTSDVPFVDDLDFNPPEDTFGDNWNDPLSDPAPRRREILGPRASSLPPITPHVSSAHSQEEEEEHTGSPLAKRGRRIVQKVSKLFAPKKAKAGEGNLALATEQDSSISSIRPRNLRAVFSQPPAAGSSTQAAKEDNPFDDSTRRSKTKSAIPAHLDNPTIASSPITIANRDRDAVTFTGENRCNHCRGKNIPCTFDKPAGRGRSLKTCRACRILKKTCVRTQKTETDKFLSEQDEARQVGKGGSKEGKSKGKASDGKGKEVAEGSKRRKRGVYKGLGRGKGKKGAERSEGEESSEDGEGSDGEESEGEYFEKEMKKIDDEADADEEDEDENASEEDGEAEP